MEKYRVLFDALDWQTPTPGARFKVHRDGSRQLRLLEITREFVEPDWCEKGHVGMVIEGELEIDFHGRLLRYPEGAAIFIPSGATSGHKARSITPRVQMFLIEDI